MNTNQLRNELVNEVIRIEGGYVNDPDDSGGETNFGITKTVARDYSYYGRMKDLPRSIAFNIYSEKYWKPICGDDMALLSQKVTEEVFDSCVNLGEHRASEILQVALNFFNNREKLYKDIVEDGDIGPGTLRALRSYLARRNELELLKALNCLQGAFYIELTRRRQKDEKYAYGWFKNRVVI